MKSIYIIFFIFLFVYNADAQMAIDIPSRSSLSANSLDQAIRTEQNMEMYTGSPRFSIPLHQITYKDLTVPIELSYNSVGIKVSQDAPWVGLGWNMSFGSIVRSKLGAVDAPPALDSISYRDRLSVTSLSSDHDQVLRNLLSVEEFERYRQSMNNSLFNDYKYYYQKFTNGPADYDFFVNAYRNQQGQPDIYYVNVPGDSFKFFLEPRTQKPIILNIENNYKVERYNSYNWSVTNGNGYIYLFTIQETTSESSETTAWLLTRITSPTGNSLEFSYQNFGTEGSIPEYFGYQTIQEGHREYYHDVITDRGTRSYYLTSISSPLEKVNFIVGPRTDIFGTGPRKLERIDVVNTLENTVLKSVKFDYTYFQSSMVGGSYAHGLSGYTTGVIKTPSTTEQFYSQRLKLNSVSIKGTDGGYEQPHKFLYYEDVQFPLKTSAAVDHWGYFNGENNGDYIPNILYLDRVTTDQKYMVVPYAVGNIDLRNHSRSLGVFPQELLDFKGGQRGASSLHAKVGMLKTVQYPTGGTLEFDWELNAFKNFKIPSIEQSKIIDRKLIDFKAENSVGYGVSDINEASSQSLKRKEFKIVVGAEVNFRATLSEPRDPKYNDTHGQADMEVIQLSQIRVWRKNSDNTKSIIYDSDFYNTGTDKIVSNGPNSTVKTREIIFKKQLGAGDYELECELLPDYLPAVSGGPSLNFSASFEKLPITTGVSYITSEFKEYLGGGIRVRKMTWRDRNNAFVKRDTFNYRDADGKSTGILTTPISYVQSRIADSYSTSSRYTSQWALYSTSNIPLSNSAKGNTVGYSSVERVQTDSTNRSLGKTVYRFLNEADQYFADLPTLPSYQNGLITAKEYYGGDGLLKRKENFEYSKLYSKYYRGFKVDQVIGSTDGGYYISFYPILSERNVQVKRSISDISSSGTTLNESTFQYNVDNGKVSKVENVLSDGKKAITSYRYPRDLRSDGLVYSQMVTNYIVDPPISEELIVNNAKTVKQTNYGSLTEGGRTYFKPWSVEVFTNGTLSEKTSFNKYDPYGNILSLITASGLEINYLWGYGGQYPIAEIKNATYADVVKVLTQPAINNLNLITHSQATMETLIKAASDKLRTSLPNAMITSYTYKPLVGMTSKTDPRGVKETYTYDSMQRLQTILDHLNYVTKSFDYHYRPN